MKKGTPQRTSQSKESTTRAVISELVSEKSKVIRISPWMVKDDLSTALAEWRVGAIGVPAALANDEDMSDEVALVSRTMWTGR